MRTINEAPPGLFAQLEDMFGEMSSNLTVALRDSDEAYAAMRKHRRALAEKFPFIEPMLEEGSGLPLRIEEHAGLQEYLSVTIQMEYRERLNLYYAGHRDCFAYLRGIGVL
ncbi:MAG: hypothetical protein FWE77_01020 [Clostridia bacterium]|nr:hypothetical protein [Clostridia bacterium]